MTVHFGGLWEADVAEALALQDSIELDLKDPQKSIVLAQIASARGHAIKAMAALVEADPFDPKAVMTLQNDVRRYRNLSTWLANSAEEARNAWRDLQASEQQQVLEYTEALLNPQVNDA